MIFRLSGDGRANRTVTGFDQIESKQEICRRDLRASGRQYPLLYPARRKYDSNVLPSASDGNATIASNSSLRWLQIRDLNLLRSRYLGDADDGI